MLIAVAGPYSAETTDARQRILDAMNHEAIMEISVAVEDKCDAILMIGDSPGANRERDLIRAKGLPVYNSISEISELAGSRSSKPH